MPSDAFRFLRPPSTAFHQILRFLKRKTLLVWIEGSSCRIFKFGECQIAPTTIRLPDLQKLKQNLFSIQREINHFAHLKAVLKRKTFHFMGSAHSEDSRCSLGEPSDLSAKVYTRFASGVRWTLCSVKTVHLVILKCILQFRVVNAKGQSSCSKQYRRQHTNTQYWVGLPPWNNSLVWPVIWAISNRPKSATLSRW